MCIEFHLVGKLDDVIHVTVDAYWAGEPKTRCSTSGRVLAFGPCFTGRHWSVTHENSIAILSRVGGQGDHEGLHWLEHQSARLFKFLVWTVSSGAKAIWQRPGPGRRAKLGGADDVGFNS